MKKIKHYWKLLTGKSEAKHPARFSLRNIWAVIQAFFRKKTRNIGGLGLSNHKYEQVLYRRLQVEKNSPECWESEVCINCGCLILDKTYEDRPCDGGCYPSMMDKKTWEEYKLNNQIKIFE